MQIKGCEVDKYEETWMVLSIIFKIRSEYSFFISMFHSVRLTSGKNWTMPTLDIFIEYMTQEQYKLIIMGKIKGSKAHSLVVHDGSHNPKQRSEDKGKAHANTKKEGNTKPFNDSSGSKGEKGKKGDKCTYYQRGFHPESSCMKKQVDQMAQIL